MLQGFWDRWGRICLLVSTLKWVISPWRVRQSRTLWGAAAQRIDADLPCDRSDRSGVQVVIHCTHAYLVSLCVLWYIDHFCNWLSYVLHTSTYLCILNSAYIARTNPDQGVVALGVWLVEEDFAFADACDHKGTVLFYAICTCRLSGSHKVSFIATWRHLVDDRFGVNLPTSTEHTAYPSWCCFWCREPMKVVHTSSDSWRCCLSYKICHVSVVHWKSGVHCLHGKVAEMSRVNWCVVITSYWHERHKHWLRYECIATRCYLRRYITAWVDDPQAQSPRYDMGVLFVDSL